jgi:hypothetical protein
VAAAICPSRTLIIFHDASPPMAAPAPAARQKRTFEHQRQGVVGHANRRPMPAVEMQD